MTGTTSPTSPNHEMLSRLNYAIGPVAAGMIIDAVDLLTFGPLGIVVGIPVGAIAGYWLGQSMGLGKNARVLCAITAAVYCTIPFTEVLPLGSIVGALSRYGDVGRSPFHEESSDTA